MEKKQINNNNQNLKIRKRDYLATEKINLGNFSTNKLSDDLQVLKIAEKDSLQSSSTKKSLQTENVHKFAQTDETYKEILALKLGNPFRGY